MTEEKKRSSFLKILIILSIIGGLVAGGLWYAKNANNKASIANVIKTEISSIIKKGNKTEVKKEPKANTPVVPKTPIVSDSVPTEAHALNVPEEDAQLPAVEQTEQDNPQEQEAPLKTLEDIKVYEEEVSPTEENLDSPPQTTEGLFNENPSEQEEQTLPKITYTWADFNSGKNCTASDFFGIQDEEITKQIRSYCKHPSMNAWQQWLQNFREAKRTYLIQQTMKEKSKYIKYLKTIPHLLFDANNMQNKGNSLKAKLDQIETAIYTHQTQKALDLMATLDDASLKLNLNMVLSEGKTLLKIQESFDNAEIGETNNA